MSETIRIEPSPKRIRIFSGGVAIADTAQAKLVWEKWEYPHYYLPESDLRMDLLVANGRTKPGGAELFDLRQGDKIVPDAAWRFSDPAELRGHLRFEWGLMDAWFEEDEEVFVHAHDPHKRIDVLRTSRRVEVFDGDVKLADSTRATLLFETGARVRSYLPKTDIRMDLLEPTDLRTGCAYKGWPRYWRRRGGDREIAWSYPTPFAEVAKIAGLVAFYDERIRVVLH